MIVFSAASPEFPSAIFQMPVLLYLDANGSYYENYHGERCPINKGNAEIFIKDAIVFYSRLQENKGFKAIFQVAFSKTNSLKNYRRF